MIDKTVIDRAVRVRTSSDRKTAMDHYYELRRAGKCATAVILCDMKDGSFQVLGQGRSLREIAQSLILGAEAVTGAQAHIAAPRFESREEPARHGIWNQSAPIPRRIRLNEAGILEPPAGENFVSCGECAHPRWYILHYNTGEGPARYACAHCGNEIAVARMDHEAGHA